MKAKAKKVLVLIYAFNESGREILYGMSMREFRAWPQSVP